MPKPRKESRLFYYRMHNKKEEHVLLFFFVDIFMFLAGGATRHCQIFLSVIYWIKNGGKKNMEKTKFAAYMAEKRKQKGLTQEQLAERLYVTSTTVSKWERGVSQT